MEATATSIAARRERREERSFASVCEDHLDDVYAYLVYLTGDTTLAEDLTGETFERALRRWRRFDPRRGGAKTWLCQLARGAALDHFRSERRRRSREDRYAAGVPEAVDPTFGEGLSPQLERALARLSADDREVVALRVLLELDNEAAARLL